MQEVSVELQHESKKRTAELQKDFEVFCKEHSLGKALMVGVRVPDANGMSEVPFSAVGCATPDLVFLAEVVKVEALGVMRR